MSKLNRCSQLQASHLRTRIDEAHRRHRTKIRTLGQEPDPDGIRRARKLVKEYDTRMQVRASKLRNQAEAKLGAEYRRLLEIVLFRPPHEALKAVKDFEKAKFHKRGE